MTAALIIAECVLLLIVLRVQGRSWMAWYLAATAIRTALFTTDAVGAALAARMDWITLPLTTGAVLECAWGVMQYWPARRTVAWFAGCMAAIGAASMRGVIMAYNVFPGQYVRPYFFAALFLGLLAVWGYAWTVHFRPPLNAYSALWLVRLGLDVVIGTWPYTSKAEWLDLFWIYRVGFLIVLGGWIWNGLILESMRREEECEDGLFS